MGSPLFASASFSKRSNSRILKRIEKGLLSEVWSLHYSIHLHTLQQLNPHLQPPPPRRSNSQIETRHKTDATRLREFIDWFDSNSSCRVCLILVSAQHQHDATLSHFLLSYSYPTCTRKVRYCTTNSTLVSSIPPIPTPGPVLACNSNPAPSCPSLPFSTYHPSILLVPIHLFPSTTTLPSDGPCLRGSQP